MTEEIVRYGDMPEWHDTFDGILEKFKEVVEENKRLKAKLKRKRRVNKTIEDVIKINDNQLQLNLK